MMIQRTCKKCSPNKTWEATNRVVILFFMLINIAFLHAQNVFHGEIVSKNGKVGIANGYILLIQNGTIFKTTTSYKDGSFTIKDVPAGDYIVEVACLGYQTICDSLSIKDTTKRTYRLKEETKDIDEVMIVADRSQMVVLP